MGLNSRERKLVFLEAGTLLISGLVMREIKFGQLKIRFYDLVGIKSRYKKITKTNLYPLIDALESLKREVMEFKEILPFRKKNLLNSINLVSMSWKELYENVPETDTAEKKESKIGFNQ